MPIPPRLVVGHLNVYVGNPRKLEAVTAMLAFRDGFRPDSLGLNEAYGLPLERNAYRGVVGRGDRARRGAHDVPILVRKSHPALGELAVQASQATEPAKLAPDRWITLALYESEVGPVGHINLHPNAGAAIHRGPVTVPVVREYAQNVKTLHRVLDLVTRMGATPVVTGDLNLSPAVDVAWSPYHVFRDHGLSWHAEGVDAIAWGSALELLGVDVVPGKVTGSDHPGLLASLERAR